MDSSHQSSKNPPSSSKEYIATPVSCPQSNNYLHPRPQNPISYRPTPPSLSSFHHPQQSSCSQNIYLRSTNASAKPSASPHLEAERLLHASCSDCYSLTASRSKGETCPLKSHHHAEIIQSQFVKGGSMLLPSHFFRN